MDRRREINHKPMFADMYTLPHLTQDGSSSSTNTANGWASRYCRTDRLYHTAWRWQDNIGIVAWLASFIACTKRCAARIATCSIMFKIRCHWPALPPHNRREKRCDGYSPTSLLGVYVAFRKIFICSSTAKLGTAIVSIDPSYKCHECIVRSKHCKERPPNFSAALSEPHTSTSPTENPMIRTDVR